MKRKILIGITAGIAIYKVCELIRLLKKSNYEVKCIMTENSTKLISPLLIQELSGNKVYVDIFENYEYLPTHVSLSEWAELIVVVPCSLNTLSKIALAKTEDLLSATIYACDLKKTKVLICPSMNANMWKHPITQKHIKLLKSIGYEILKPQEGELLCGKKGIGRLPETQEILRKIESLLYK